MLRALLFHVDYIMFHVKRILEYKIDVSTNPIPDATTRICVASDENNVMNVKNSLQQSESDRQSLIDDQIVIINDDHNEREFPRKSPGGRREVEPSNQQQRAEVFCLDLLSL